MKEIELKIKNNTKANKKIFSSHLLTSSLPSTNIIKNYVYVNEKIIIK